tara:strand:+ start:865 stop:1119 length:255 start_codon:yes stop_codon:yes gene_type:complete
MSYLINGGFPQTMHSYINVRQPLRLELFDQYKVKMKKAQEDAKDPQKAIAALHKTLKFSSDNAFGYKDRNIINPNTNEDPTMPN